MYNLFSSGGVQAPGAFPLARVRTVPPLRSSSGPPGCFGVFCGVFPGVPQPLPDPVSCSACHLCRYAGPFCFSSGPPARSLGCWRLVIRCLYIITISVNSQQHFAQIAYFVYLHKSKRLKCAKCTKGDPGKETPDSRGKSDLHKAARRRSWQALSDPCVSWPSRKRRAPCRQMDILYIISRARAKRMIYRPRAV